MDKEEIVDGDELAKKVEEYFGFNPTGMTYPYEYNMALAEKLINKLKEIESRLSRLDRLFDNASIPLREEPYGEAVTKRHVYGKFKE